MSFHLTSSVVLANCLFNVTTAFAGDGGTLLRDETAERPRAALSVWDTGTSSSQPLAPKAVEQKNGWKPIASSEAAYAFQGDAVIANGRLLAVARKQGRGVELYSLGSGKPVFRARLVVGPGLGDRSQGINRVALAENTRSGVGLEVASKSGTARFRLKKGEQFIESQAVSGEAPLRVECPSRFALLPDFFADDILFDARNVPLDKVELPSENFLLHFTGPQDAIVMSVFENRAQDVRVTLAGKGDARAITGSEIEFGKKGSKIWVAVIEGAGIWHSINVSAADVKKVIPLDWRMPFLAQWRVDFTRQDGLTDSWDMLLPEKEGNGFIKPSWLAQDGKISAATRTATGEVDRDAYKPGGPASDRLGPDRARWTTVLGQVRYPCWSDREGKGFLQPLENKRLTFDGPVLIYPITRLAETPVECYTPVDIVRNTLGVGPCQYLLDVEGQKQEHVGRATCHVRTLLKEIYGSGRQKAMRKEIETYLGDALDFVTHIRNRILAYVAFGKELQYYLQEQRAVHPELKESLDELRALAGQIGERVKPRMQAILQHKTLKELAAKVVEQRAEPTPPALAAQLNRDFIAKGLLDYEGVDWENQLKKEYTDPLTAIGGQQDEMVGECRWVVKALRQKAGILMATDARMAPVAAEIRARTQKMLRGGAAYEGARH
ncbi:MAG TPA: hypothetical protein VGX70_08750 [Gemmataceae bacterium]|nr:hypothetical protein [Gemmataceae bacterium]